MGLVMAWEGWNRGAKEEIAALLGDGDKFLRLWGRLGRAGLVVYLLRLGELQLGKWSKPFPGSLSGLVISTAGLLILARKRPLTAERFVSWVQPATDFLSWWMPLFFSPPLVGLPVALDDVLRRAGPASGLKGLAILAGGFLATLVSTAFFVRACSRGGHHVGDSTGTNPPVNLSRALPPPTNSLNMKSFLLGTAVCILSVTGRFDNINLGAFSALSYVFGSYLPQSFRASVHPVILCGTLSALAAAGLVCGNGTKTWRNALQEFTGSHGPGGQFMKLLGPALIAFAVRLYRSRRILFQNTGPLILGSAFGSFVSLYGTAVASRLLGVNEEIATALVPRAITTPLAVAMAKVLRANSSLTVVAVVCSGVLGANFGARLLSSVGLSPNADAIARGVAVGSASHGLGVAALANSEVDASSAAAVSLALTGAISTILMTTPSMRRMLFLIQGSTPR